MEDDLYKLLLEVDTPTVCNAIEVAQGKRGFNRFTKATMFSSHPESESVVGYARTAEIEGRLQSVDPPEQIQKLRMDYYRYVAESPKPAVIVIEDKDFPNCVGAFWGEINTTVHKGFGISGAVTNGVMRDLGSLPDNFPVVAGSISPSHGFVRVTGIDTPIKIFDMDVKPGELIHADRHGALVIPKEVISNLKGAIEKLIRMENLILEPARSKGFDFDSFTEAWNKFEAERT